LRYQKPAIMKHVSILITNDAVLASIVDPRIIFTGVNDFLEAAGKPPVFKVQLIGLAPEVRLHNGLFSVHTDALLKDVPKSDIVIIPAMGGDMPAAIKRNEEFLPWIAKQYSQGAEVASLCVGAFLLAATGLLNGKECSSHWRFANQFREMFPEGYFGRRQDSYRAAGALQQRRRNFLLEPAFVPGGEARRPRHEHPGGKNVCAGN
jgi:transcriptional regulator GlxA family with amidase domain